MAIDPAYLQIGWKDPSESFLQGLNNGMQAINNVNVLKANQAEAERKQQVFDQEQLRQKEMLAKRNEIITKGANLKDVQDFIFAYPEFSKPYEPILGNLKDTEKQDLFLLTRGAYNAMENNRPDIAKSEMERLAKAYENSGKPDWADSTRQFANAIDTNPKLVKYQLGGFSTMLDPNAAKTIGEEARANEMQPYDIAKKQADTAKTNAETADIPLAAIDRAQGVANQARNNELENQYKYDQLGQLDRQFYDSLDDKQKQEANKLRAAKNETDTQKMARLEKAQSFSNTANNAAGTAKLAAELINDYKKLSDASGAGLWNAAMRNVPGTAEYDFARRVDTLKSQAFLIGSQNLKGLGAMTEMEGKKVTDALGNLDLSQNTAQVAQQLAVIAKAANAVAQNANKNAQNYATKGRGYSPDVVKAAQTLGITPAEAQKFVNDHGL